MNPEGVVAKLFPWEDPSSTQFSVHFPRYWSGVPLRFPSTPCPTIALAPLMSFCFPFHGNDNTCVGTVKYDVYYTFFYKKLVYKKLVLRWPKF